MSSENKTRRPRIDAVIRAIKEGSYDDKLNDLEDAIESRNDHRKEQVMKMVKRVYGEDYVVQNPSQISGPPFPPVLQPLADYEVEPGDIPQVRDPEAPDDDGESEILSTGAQIGGLPEPVNQEQLDLSNTAFRV